MDAYWGLKWWPGDLKNMDINNHGTDPVLLEYSGLDT